VARVNKRILIAVAAVVVLGGLVAVNLKPKASTRGSDVRTEVTAARRIESWVRAPGKVQPVSKVQVSSNVMGRVIELAVKEGQRVAKGDLLLRLDDERYRSMVQQYRAAIQSGEAQVTLAEAEEREAKDNLARTEKLAPQGLASDQELIASRTRAQVSAARVKAALEEVSRAKAGLAQGEKDLRETVFLAPMPGVVTALNVEAGENVMTGTMNNPGTVILTLADLSAMEILADVDETDVVRIATGQAARVFVDAIPDTTFPGVVTRVGQSGRGSTGAAQEATSFEVAVLLNDPPEGIRSGMNADVEILTGTADSVLAVPLQALTARPPAVVERWKAKRENRKFDPATVDTTGPGSRNLVEGVFLFEDGKARFVPVVLGLRGETHVEVSGDLTVGSKLIIGPYKTVRRLNDQDRVRLEKKKSSKKKGKDSEESTGSKGES
jgi:HlyD family secretion protein